ncbi:LysR family glycine cleavage system transcriptional activator [Bradyrhizobium sp. USDA 3315]
MAQTSSKRGRRRDLTEFGKLSANAVSEPLETVGFRAKRMRRRAAAGSNRLVVRTSLSTFAFSILIPNLQAFSSEMGGVIVDVVSSLSPPTSSDDFDILITRDLSVIEPADSWEIYNEELVCVGPPNLVAGGELSIIRSTPILNITSRPDILPTWLRAMNLSSNDIKPGARYDHNYLALPAVMTGKCLLVAPEIIVSDLVRRGVLQVIPGSRTPSGMQYRAYAVDRSEHPEIARSFCRWVSRLCKKSMLAQAA